jgi:hypothetical protein
VFESFWVQHKATETQQAQSQAQTGTAQAQPESSEEPDDLPFKRYEEFNSSEN